MAWEPHTLRRPYQYSVKAESALRSARTIWCHGSLLGQPDAIAEISQHVHATGLSDCTLLLDYPMR